MNCTVSDESGNRFLSYDNAIGSDIDDYAAPYKSFTCNAHEMK